MDIPKEIIVVPLKDKKPLFKNKKRAIQITSSTITSIATLVVLYYYPAPSQFTFQNAVPIGAMITLVFLAILFTAYIFLPFKKALLVASILTSTLLLNKSRIITIVTYAICIPLLFVKLTPLKNQNQ